VWINAKTIGCDEVIKPHLDWAISAYRAVYHYAVGQLDPVDPTRLSIARSFATFTRDALRDQEQSVKILEDALSPINDLLINTMTEAAREEVENIRETLESWRSKVPSDSPSV
jgi:hypothetical protein